MDTKKASPVLDYNMIMERNELFNSLLCYAEALKQYKQKSHLFCEKCRGGLKAEFAQSIRDELIENKHKHIFKLLPPNTIVRYGKRIFRASDFI